MLLPSSTLVFDTETTGFPVKGGAVNDPRQPHITQIGAILYDSSWAVRAELNVLIRLDQSVTIPPIVTEKTGIDWDLCYKYGVPLNQALPLLVSLIDRAALSVAFNSPFDQQLTEFAAHRCAMEPIWLKRRLVCAMKPLTNVMKLPGPYGFKWPKLTEAYEYCFNEPLLCAHDAMADVRGTGRVFNYAIRQGWIKL